jgi:uncharacterized membrane protein
MSARRPVLRAANRIAVVLYLVGTVVFLAAVVLLFANDPIDDATLQTIALSSLLASWLLLAAGALTDAFLSPLAPAAPEHE